MKYIILLLCYAGIFWLFRKDISYRRLGSAALLLPCFWVGIQGSRPLSYWIPYGGGGEAHPANTYSFLLFIVISFGVLVHRNMPWGTMIGRNFPIFLIYGYFLISASWSDAPFTSGKRLLKDFGVVLVGLVILTNISSPTVMRTIFVRASYVLFPLSVVFIKYFPQIGRQSSNSGSNMFTGITTAKNSLGLMVFILSIFIIWDLMILWKNRKTENLKIHIYIRIGMVLMGLWLLVTCDSKTSLLCLLIGCFLFWVSSKLKKMPNGKATLIWGLIGVAILTTVDDTLGISDRIIVALGRDPSLTGRKDIWDAVFAQDLNHVFGQGFLLFWDTDTARAAEAMLNSNPLKTAHNGYIEMYIDGGIIGAVLICILALAVLIRSINRLFSGHPLGEIALIFAITTIIYNFSESSFFRLDLLWFTFLLVYIDPPYTSNNQTAN